MKSSSQNGFTLIELLVVISIIGLLSTFALISLDNSRKKARDTARRQALKQLQTAVELYYDSNKIYPEPCQGYGVWSGHCPNYGNCDTNYIKGLALYLSKLPIDPKWDDTNRGYLYRSDGADYKIISHYTVETGIATNDPFYDPIRPTWAWAIYSPGGKNW